MEIIKPTTPNVHILVARHKPELAHIATLVLSSVRTAFPTFPIFIWDNATDIKWTLEQEAKKLEATYRHISYTGAVMMYHWEWIRHLATEEENNNFLIVDTDVVFFEDMQHLFYRDDAVVMGEYVPTFFDPITKKTHMERFHTAVMMIHANKLLNAEIDENKKRPNSMTKSDLVTPFTAHFRGTSTYYDTMTNAYHHCGGRVELNQPEAFVHLHCGSWMGYVKKLNKDFWEKLKKRQDEVVANPKEHYMQYREELKAFYQTQS